MVEWIVGAAVLGVAGGGVWFLRRKRSETLSIEAQPPDKPPDKPSGKKPREPKQVRKVTAEIINP